MTKKHYTDRQVEDYHFSKDMNVRQKIMKIYNKKREDFESEEQFWTYQEEIEDIIMQLVEETNLEVVKQRI